MAPATRNNKRKAAGKRTAAAAAPAAAAPAAASRATDDENAELKKQIADLQQQMVVQQRQVLAELPKKKDVSKQEQFRRVINEAIKHSQWRHWKFVPRGEEDEKTVAKAIYKAVAAEYSIYRFKNKAERDDFIDDHLTDFATELNNVRAYVTSRIKESMKAWFDAHEYNMPDFKKIMACATRKLDLDQKEDLEIFEWYWEDLLVKATGNKADWDYNKRWYTTICENAPSDAPDKPYVTPQTEAFAVLCVENHYKTWGSQFKLKVENKASKLLAPKKTHADATGPVKEGNNIYMCGPDFATKWTETTGGSSKYGGYSEEGTDVYAEYSKKIKNIRKNPSTKEFERKFLTILRQKLEISARSHDEHKAKKRRKKPVVPRPSDKEYTSLIDSDYADSSDEEEEYDD